MLKRPLPRRVFYILVAIAFVVVNPIHLPFSLPWLARQWEGSPAGAFLSRYQSTILVVSTVYFMMATMAFYMWMWSRRPRRKVEPPAATASTNGGHALSASYRGPGGGKTPPRHSRRHVRR